MIKYVFLVKTVPQRTEPFVMENSLQQLKTGCTFATHLRHKC